MIIAYIIIFKQFYNCIQLQTLLSLYQIDDNFKKIFYYITTAGNRSSYLPFKSHENLNVSTYLAM